MRLKNWFGVITAVLFGVSGIGVSIPATPVPCEAKEQEREYLILSSSETNIDSIIAKNSNTESTDIFIPDNMEVCRMTESQAKQLQQNQTGIIVEKNEELLSCSQKGKAKKGKLSNSEWNIQAIHAEKAKKDKSEKKIKVAIIDSGVDNYNDVELKECVNFLPGEEEVSPLYVDVTGHGSSVAGIIAAKDNGEGITGIAPEVELYSAKVFDSENRSTISRVVQAIYWAIEKRVHILNMSFGTPTHSPALRQAIKDAARHNILLIASAGNNNTIEYPAAYDEVMAVGSVNTSGEISGHSAVGNQLEIVAPGEQICTTGAFGGTIVATGTSMSAPHVTGVAAKLWGKDKSVSATFIRQLLDASANQFTLSSHCGYGFVDYAYAERIYDDFKSSYMEGASLEKNSADIDDNEKEIETFEQIDFIEGRWSKEAHQSAIKNASLSGTDIKNIKKGVIYPDIAAATKRMTNHPYWHGRRKKCNYVYSYIYATNMALALKKGESLSKATAPRLFSTQHKTSMKNAVSNIAWSSQLTSVSKKNKCLFVWGMAIHDAMDVYSHSAVGRINGVWQRLDHPKPIATNPQNGLADRTDAGAFPERYQTAYKVAQKSLTTYISGSAGKASDFAPSGAYRNAGITWVIELLSSNIENIDATTATQLKPYSCKKIK